MKTLRLNTKKLNNFAYFDPISRIHLTLINPVDRVKELNENLTKAIKSETLVVLEDSSKTEDVETVNEEKVLSADKDLEDENTETVDKTEEVKEDDDSEEEPEEVKEDSEAEVEENGKVACQYCGKEYSPNGVKRHESSCDDNPDNK